MTAFVGVHNTTRLGLSDSQRMLLYLTPGFWSPAAAADYGWWFIHQIDPSYYFSKPNLRYILGLLCLTFLNQGFKIHKSLDVRYLQWIFCLVTTENCDDDINTANKYDSCVHVHVMSDILSIVIWQKMVVLHQKSRWVASNWIAFCQYLSVIFWHWIDIKLIKIQPKWDILRTTKFSQAIN